LRIVIIAVYSGYRLSWRHANRNPLSTGALRRGHGGSAESALHSRVAALYWESRLWLDQAIRI